MEFTRNFEEIEEKNLRSDFNSYIVRKQFILANEIISSDARGEANAIKNLITRYLVQINEKHIKGYSLRDCCNWYVTSNSETRAMYLDKYDRRIAVFLSRQTERLPSGWGEALMKWAITPEGGGAIHHWLRETDMRGLTPRMRRR